MKIFFPTLLFLFIMSFFISCEPGGSDDTEPEAEDIIEIPDVHFKNALVNTNSIDTNGDGVGDRDMDLNNDGEIQRSEAELVEGLILQVDRNEAIKYIDLSGIGNFINLKYFKFTGTGDWMSDDPAPSERLTYDLTRLKKLEYLEIIQCDSRFIKTIDLTGLSNLVEANLYMNSPYRHTSMENITHPEKFIDVYMQGCNSLTDLDIHNSYLNINFCQIPTLKILDMHYLEGGEPEVFDFHCLTNLEWLDISENFIKSLILKNSSVLTTFRVQYIGPLGDPYYIPSPQYICIDDIPEELEQIALIRDDYTVVATDCEF